MNILKEKPSVSIRKIERKMESSTAAHKGGERETAEKEGQLLSCVRRIVKAWE